jgi:hypothetical protein
VTARSSTGDVVAVGVAPLSTNGQVEALILANNEPSTAVATASVNNTQVLGTFADSLPVEGHKLHGRT